MNHAKPQTARVLPLMPWSASHAWQLKPFSLTVLLVALALFGVGEGLLVQAVLGSTPWVVFAQGVGLQTGWSLGWATFVISVCVLLLWLPLRQKAGFGTVANMVFIALFLDLFVQYVSPPASMFGRVLFCVGGILVIGTASAFYLTCQLGAGPRDGLMVGLCRRTGWRIGVVRTLIEASVCLVGYLLGGTVGIGTLMFALGVGWVVQAALFVLKRCFPNGENT
ncbi:MAG: YitT family protein [Neisseria sp.]|nr:YitT family protein [Neisseria sp.]